MKMRRILVVDDDPDVRAYVSHVLVHGGYFVTESSNGKEAIDEQRKHPFDLIITDIFMPVAEGLSTILKLRREYPDLKIIAISGGGNPNMGDYLTHAALYGADATLAKPFASRVLLETTEHVLATPMHLIKSDFA
jgi:CheY-like chemotaxis protein